jgi:hypothetical protein
MFPKLTPLCKNQCSLVFIEKVLLGFQTSPSTFPFLLFSSFFVNFDFSYCFLYFWKRANINIDSMREINDFKNDAWKVERVPNIFENLNSFETMLKMLKNDANVLKTYFFGYSMFFAIFEFFWKFIKTWVKNWVATMIVKKITPL